MASAAIGNGKTNEDGERLHFICELIRNRKYQWWRRMKKNRADEISSAGIGDKMKMDVYAEWRRQNVARIAYCAKMVLRRCRLLNHAPRIAHALDALHFTPYTFTPLCCFCGMATSIDEEKA